MPTRLEEMISLIQQRPNDPFAQYALAMEYKNQNQAEQALASFEKLYKNHPTYLPQYLMHGNLLQQLNQSVQAHTVYQQGIQVARQLQNYHTLGELQRALESLNELD